MAKKIRFNKRTLTIALVAIAVIALLVAWFGFGLDPLGFFSGEPEVSETLPADSTSAPDSHSDVTTAKPSETTAKPAATTAKPAVTTSKPAETEPAPKIDENGVYTTKEDVALYIYTYHKLPANFITKTDAEKKAGWTGGGLDKYKETYGMCIGGDKFGNNEKKLPVVKGRQYYECDINTLHANARGAERLVFTYDGTVYYTGDHYETFTLLYGEK